MESLPFFAFHSLSNYCCNGLFSQIVCAPLGCKRISQKRIFRIQKPLHPPFWGKRFQWSVQSFCHELSWKIPSDFDCRPKIGFRSFARPVLNIWLVRWGRKAQDRQHLGRPRPDHGKYILPKHHSLVPSGRHFWYRNRKGDGALAGGDRLHGCHGERRSCSFFV